MHKNQENKKVSKRSSGAMDKYVTREKRKLDEEEEEVSSSVVMDVPRVPGLVVEEGFLSPQEEAGLLAHIDSGVWRDDLERRTQQFGFVYAYGWTGELTMLGPLPAWMQPVLDKLTKRGFTGFDQVIVNEYVPGQGIGPHVDSPQLFGDTVVSVSLGSDVVMNFSNGFIYEDIFLKTRSAVVLTDDARYKWTHEIKHRKTDVCPRDGVRRPRRRRVSLTFRQKKK